MAERIRDEVEPRPERFESNARESEALEAIETLYMANLERFGIRLERSELTSRVVRRVGESAEIDGLIVTEAVHLCFSEFRDGWKTFIGGYVRAQAAKGRLSGSEVIARIDGVIWGVLQRVLRHQLMGDGSRLDAIGSAPAFVLTLARSTDCDLHREARGFRNQDQRPRPTKWRSAALGGDDFLIELLVNLENELGQPDRDLTPGTFPVGRLAACMAEVRPELPPDRVSPARIAVDIETIIIRLLEYEERFPRFGGWTDNNLLLPVSAGIGGSDVSDLHVALSRIRSGATPFAASEVVGDDGHLVTMFPDAVGSNRNGDASNCDDDGSIEGVPDWMAQPFIGRRIPELPPIVRALAEDETLADPNRRDLEDLEVLAAKVGLDPFEVAAAIDEAIMPLLRDIDPERTSRWFDAA